MMIDGGFYFIECFYVNFVNDEKNKYIEYYPNGMKWWEVTLKDGKEDGLWTQWNENGQKSEERNYKDGELDRSLTKWYKNVEKKSERTYKNG